MDTNSNTNVLLKRDPKSRMPLIASILILVAAIAIAIFFWNQRPVLINQNGVPSNTELIAEDPAPLSTSDDLSDIEADLENTTIYSLDIE